MLDARFSRRHDDMIVTTYEAVQVLTRLGSSSGRESRSVPRRSMDSLSQCMSGYSRKRNCDLL